MPYSVEGITTMGTISEETCRWEATLDILPMPFSGSSGTIVQDAGGVKRIITITAVRAATPSALADHVAEIAALLNGTFPSFSITL